ncbi:MAG: HPF/RaiA family ribosome-associated protein [Pseudomonas sp.]|uniref:HPF/RaiA family ribosome-associated protein n=1 Tax=Pseudomonas sp. TaxID=306 RepID=UPI00339770A2
MHVQVNSNQIEGNARLQEWVGSAVMARLERFEELLTRVEVHISDENAQKSGPDDKRCQIEARPKGHQPLSVSHKAADLDLAVEGAAEKMRHALEHLMGRLDAKVVSTGRLEPVDAAVDESADALLEEEFLEKLDALDDNVQNS